MTSSRNKQFPLISGIIGLTLGLTVAVTSAQEKPRSLVPSLNKVEPSKPNSQTVIPLDSSAPKTGPERVIEGSGLSGPVVVQTLGGLDASSVGTLDLATGSLGSAMWSGTDPERVVTLLKHLPVATRSPQMQKLLKRLLLTPAAIPQGLTNPTELIELRLKKLREAGLVLDAVALLGRLPPATMTPDLKKMQVELLLLQGQNTEACKQGSSQKTNSKDVFWEKLEIVCNVFEGKLEKAELGATLLEEQDGASDSIFFDLFDRLAGGKSVLPDNEEPLTALHYAMMREAKLPMSFERLEKAGYDLLWALATQQSADLDERLRAAYKSLAIGSVRPGLSRRLITEGGLQDNSEDASSLARISSLYRQFQAEKDGAEKPTILENIWTEAIKDNSFFAAASLTLPLLQQIPASRQSEEFEFNALRLYLMEGDTANAQGWERIVRRAALRGTPAEREDARKRITRVDAYMLISGAPGIARWNAESFDLWSFAAGSDPKKSANVGLLLSILGDFGQEISPALWSKALDLGQVPRASNSNLVLEKNLEIASEREYIGETIALALTVLGEAGPSGVSTTTLSTVLNSLKRIGMEAEARNLALEAAILRDI
ncbi:MAG: hypothetical protein NXI13_11790 [Proteobacteria bacterium]|nr:hypothetical protein [Pseudomonadota bacterium]